MNFPFLTTRMTFFLLLVTDVVHLPALLQTFGYRIETPVDKQARFCSGEPVCASCRWECCFVQSLITRITASGIPWSLILFVYSFTRNLQGRE